MNKVESALQRTTDTKALVIGVGTLPRTAEMFNELFPGCRAVVVADTNTWRVAGGEVHRILADAGIGQDEPHVFADPKLYAEWSFVEELDGVLAATDALTLEAVTAANAPAVLAFNNTNGLFADENLRLAVSYALDYDSFRTVFGSAYASNPNCGFVPPVTVGYKETEALGQDLTKAAQCMADAGYAEKNADGFYVNADGEVCAFTLTCNAGKEAHVGYAELVKTQLEQFGIQVDLETLDGDSYNAKTSNKFSENNITMEAAIYGYTAAGMGMKNGLASIYVDGTHPVQGGCQVFDEDFQVILSAMGEAKTVEEYTAAAGSLQDWYAAHTPLIALYWDSQILVHSAAYENFTVDAVFGLNNANTWFSITAK